MKSQRIHKKYPAYTLMEMLVVMSIFIILGAMTFSAFDGLQNTVKLNEYMLTLEQDIRNVQRSAMLLQRNTGERWLYGLGIDFSEITADGEYRMFKWCSPFDDYGHITTKSKIPGYDPSLQLANENGKLPIFDLDYNSSSCLSSEFESELKNLPGYENSAKPPKAQIVIAGSEEEKRVRYVIFESVSGRTFFYNSVGEILNYDSSGAPVPQAVNFDLHISPTGKGSTRRLTINNLSGKITTYMYQ